MDSVGSRADRADPPAPAGPGVPGGRDRSPGLPAGESPARARRRAVRLFVALNLPDQVRRALWDAAAPVRDLGLPVRWVSPEGIHLTLKFLGDVADEQEPELRAALTRAAGGGRPLPVAVRGFGVFPDYVRPRVIWAGLDPDPALELLQHRVEREFGPLGFPTE